MKEFIALMAFLTALIALSIDAMLPSLGVMAEDLGVTNPNHIQYVVGFIFIGMTIGQLFYGPLADAIGRKPTLFIGIGLFMIGSFISWLADDITVMLAGRFIQGLGVASPRIMTMAIVRDKYHGREMAQVMSLVMGVFIMVPAVAPSIGQVIIHVAGWRAIFLFYILCNVLAGVWAWIRLEETLAPENRRPFEVGTIWTGIKEIFRTRMTMGYTICSGIVFGALLGYLNSVQQIFHDIFKVGDMFAVYFGLLALAIGAAFFSNSALVRKHGMRKITSYALILVIAASALFMASLILSGANLLFFMLFAATAFFSLGLTFGNMGAMALEPMGHMAGLASAFMGAISTAISIVAGTIIGQFYDGSLYPLASGFLVLTVAGLLMMIWTERGFPHNHPENIGT